MDEVIDRISGLSSNLPNRRSRMNGSIPVELNAGIGFEGVVTGVADCGFDGF